MNDKERFLIFQKANKLKIDEERILEIERFLEKNKTTSLFKISGIATSDSILITGEIVEEIKKSLMENKKQCLDRMKDILNFSSEGK